MGTTDDEIENSGRRLADKSDTWLVGFASRGGAAAEAIEMQRRLLVAIREFNQKSRQQITSLSWLTVAVGDALGDARLGHHGGRDGRRQSLERGHRKMTTDDDGDYEDLLKLETLFLEKVNDDEIKNLYMSAAEVAMPSIGHLSRLRRTGGRTQNRRHRRWPRQIGPFFSSTGSGC